MLPLGPRYMSPTLQAAWVFVALVSWWAWTYLPKFWQQCSVYSNWMPGRVFLGMRLSETPPLGRKALIHISDD